jgi:hypothetical protein
MARPERGVGHADPNANRLKHDRKRPGGVIN